MSIIGGNCMGNAQRYILAILALSAQFAFAMPDKDEIKRVQPMVLELMSVHMKDHKANRKSAKEVGDAAVELAKDAEGEAAKYVLLKGAIEYYTLAKEYDLVADALESLRASVKDLPTEDVAAIASRVLNRARQGEAQRLRTIRRIAALQAKAEVDIKSYKSELRKRPDDKEALGGLADAYVRLGDWQKALKAFSKLGVKAAAFELAPAENKDFDSLKAADFWWSCRAQETAPYRAHAAVLYKAAMEEGLVKGLQKNLVEKRIAEVEAPEIPVAAVGGGMAGKLYCIIDLSAGSNADKYPVSYRDSKPNDGWTDVYKTNKLVLRRIEPGMFTMGEDQKNEFHRVTLTKPFYIGVFEMTQRQYVLVMGDNPSKFKGDKRPVEMVSYIGIRGNSEGAKWPASFSVDSDSFLGKLRTRTGLNFDLPTDAQWEYACRAGTTSEYNNGGDSENDLKSLGRFTLNQNKRGWRESKGDFARHKPDGKGSCQEAHTVVGSYKPNAWGLYDMHGNVWEWCLDWLGSLKYGIDPRGPSSGRCRVRRGGSWCNTAYYCTSSYQIIMSPMLKGIDDTGFRLAITLSE